MTQDELQAAFEEAEDESHEFDRVEHPLASRPDLAAFLLLNKLVPDTEDMIMSAEHDQIWLGVDIEALASVARQEDIVTLRRCGVWYDTSTDSLSLFV